MIPDEVKDILRFGIQAGVGMSEDGHWLNPARDKLKMFVDAGDRYVINPEYIDHIYLNWRRSKEGFKLE